MWGLGSGGGGGGGGGRGCARIRSVLNRIMMEGISFFFSLKKK